MIVTTPLGFSYDANVLPASETRSVVRAIAIYNQRMAEFVWDVAKLENNPLTFVDIQTLLGGVTIGGYKVRDVEQVTNLADSSRKLLKLIRSGHFRLNKETLMLLNSIITRNETPEGGIFRDECGHNSCRANAEASELNRIFMENLQSMLVMPPVEAALIFFLFCMFQQFFFNGNKRTGLYMMNGWLMSNGFDPISIPAFRSQEFNDKMRRFYTNKDATEMLAFLWSCKR
ncbi:hypothetical protein M979_2144 [Buttiauxella noackiae ATCC 51607]|uniref:Fido domain-containing protein n=1 Tax=Buttiauxella noackiae ATCC 51607 TaxID=1354255 RepID=A0A1B7HPU3_9ENTR|nr:Fic family protein [Buttiauxella noackiae]OAT17649.1 hypothetical protein M979_2144 [Buttiauxella noackiae ATCC 51607]